MAANIHENHHQRHHELAQELVTLIIETTLMNVVDMIIKQSQQQEEEGGGVQTINLSSDTEAVVVKDDGVDDDDDDGNNSDGDGDGDNYDTNGSIVNPSSTSDITITAAEEVEKEVVAENSSVLSSEALPVALIPVDELIHQARTAYVHNKYDACLDIIDQGRTVIFKRTSIAWNERQQQQQQQQQESIFDDIDSNDTTKKSNIKCVSSTSVDENNAFNIVSVVTELQTYSNQLLILHIYCILDLSLYSIAQELLYDDSKYSDILRLLDMIRDSDGEEHNDCHLDNNSNNNDNSDDVSSSDDYVLDATTLSINNNSDINSSDTATANNDSSNNRPKKAAVNTTATSSHDSKKKESKKRRKSIHEEYNKYLQEFVLSKTGDDESISDADNHNDDDDYNSIDSIEKLEESDDDVLLSDTSLKQISDKLHVSNKNNNNTTRTYASVDDLLIAVERQYLKGELFKLTGRYYDALHAYQQALNLLLLGQTTPMTAPLINSMSTTTATAATNTTATAATNTTATAATTGSQVHSSKNSAYDTNDNSSSIKIALLQMTVQTQMCEVYLQLNDFTSAALLLREVQLIHPSHDSDNSSNSNSSSSNSSSLLKEFMKNASMDKQQHQQEEHHIISSSNSNNTNTLMKAQITVLYDHQYFLQSMLYKYQSRYEDCITLLQSILSTTNSHIMSIKANFELILLAMLVNDYGTSYIYLENCIHLASSLFPLAASVFKHPPSKHRNDHDDDDDDDEAVHDFAAPAHSIIARIVYLKGSILLNLEKHSDALVFFEKAHNMYNEVYMDVLHTSGGIVTVSAAAAVAEIGMCMWSEGEVHRLNGEYDKAEAKYQQAYDVLVNCYMPPHMITTSSSSSVKFNSNKNNDNSFNNNSHENAAATETSSSSSLMTAHLDICQVQFSQGLVFLHTHQYTLAYHQFNQVAKHQYSLLFHHFHQLSSSSSSLFDVKYSLHYEMTNIYLAYSHLLLYQLETAHLLIAKTSKHIVAIFGENAENIILAQCFYVFAEVLKYKGRYLDSSKLYQHAIQMTRNNLDYLLLNTTSEDNHNHTDDNDGKLDSASVAMVDDANNNSNNNKNNNSSNINENNNINNNNNISSQNQTIGNKDSIMNTTIAQSATDADVSDNNSHNNHTAASLNDEDSVYSDSSGDVIINGSSSSSSSSSSNNNRLKPASTLSLLSQCNSTSIAKIMISYVASLRSAGHVLKANIYTTPALNILLKLYPRDHVFLLPVLHERSNLVRDIQDYEKAEIFYISLLHLMQFPTEAFLIEMLSSSSDTINTTFSDNYHYRKNQSHTNKQYDIDDDEICNNNNNNNTNHDHHLMNATIASIIQAQNGNSYNNKYLKYYAAVRDKMFLSSVLMNYGECLRLNSKLDHAKIVLLLALQIRRDLFQSSSSSLTAARPSSATEAVRSYFANDNKNNNNNSSSNQLHHSGSLTRPDSAPRLADATTTLRASLSNDADNIENDSHNNDSNAASRPSTALNNLSVCLGLNHTLNPSRPSSSSSSSAVNDPYTHNNNNNSITHDIARRSSQSHNNSANRSYPSHTVRPGVYYIYECLVSLCICDMDSNDLDWIQMAYFTMHSFLLPQLKLILPPTHPYLYYIMGNIGLCKNAIAVIYFDNGRLDELQHFIRHNCSDGSEKDGVGDQAPVVAVEHWMVTKLKNTLQSSSSSSSSSSSTNVATDISTDLDGISPPSVNGLSAMKKLYLSSRGQALIIAASSHSTRRLKSASDTSSTNNIATTDRSDDHNSKSSSNNNCNQSSLQNDDYDDDDLPGQSMIDAALDYFQCYNQIMFCHPHHNNNSNTQHAWLIRFGAILVPPPLVHTGTSGVTGGSDSVSI